MEIALERQGLLRRFRLAGSGAAQQVGVVQGFSRAPQSRSRSRLRSPKPSAPEDASGCCKTGGSASGRSLQSSSWSLPLASRSPASVAAPGSVRATRRWPPGCRHWPGFPRPARRSRPHRPAQPAPATASSARSGAAAARRVPDAAGRGPVRSDRRRYRCRRRPACPPQPWRRAERRPEQAEETAAGWRERRPAAWPVPRPLPAPVRPPGARRTPQRQVQGDPALRFDRRDRSLFAAATQQQHAEQSEDQQQDDHPAPVLRVRRRFNRLRNRRRGRGGRRRRGPHRLAPGQLLLQFGDLVIALLQLFLQGLQLALQIVHPLAQFLPLPGQRLGLGIRLALRSTRAAGAFSTTAASAGGRTSTAASFTAPGAPRSGW